MGAQPLRCLRAKGYVHVLGAGEDEKPDAVTTGGLGVGGRELPGLDQARQLGHQPAVLPQPGLQELLMR